MLSVQYGISVLVAQISFMGKPEMVSWSVAVFLGFSFKLVMSYNIRTKNYKHDSNHRE